MYDERGKKCSVYVCHVTMAELVTDLLACDSEIDFNIISSVEHMFYFIFLPCMCVCLCIFFFLFFFLSFISSDTGVEITHNFPSDLRHGRTRERKGYGLRGGGEALQCSAR